ncbi:P-loop NTPase family protein [Photobacterium sanguinicancri]|uniref:Chromosome partitioning protein ParA n=1 Tax=Photobacterium sanguinicancri TaxID=875932 RepID=A0AAW7Y9W4_9GAMM|nr:hypothetical protein [Photobacterium sanguinicancri]KXI23020.1 hypothetical protein AS132_10170 [Photobacterium sanguinicancri]MDO6545137.1 hypothetical protein [Photobacterium sanguinicancri]
MKPWLSQEFDQLFQQIHQRQCRIITFAGASSGCGTSTQAYWLAQRLSADQPKTLLIDLDLAGSGQGYPKADWSCQAADFSKHIRVLSEELDLLPQPQSQQTILELRQPQILAAAVKQWLDDYQYIICDVGNINTANWRNLAIASISHASNGTILCIAAGKTTESEVLASVQRLEQGNVDLIGTLINDQINPTLAEEIRRVMENKAKWLPKIMKQQIRNYLQTNPLLQGKYQ